MSLCAAIEYCSPSPQLYDLRFLGGEKETLLSLRLRDLSFFRSLITYSSGFPSAGGAIGGMTKNGVPDIPSQIQPPPLCLDQLAFCQQQYSGNDFKIRAYSPLNLSSNDSGPVTAVLIKNN